jgi:hypothetical protein
MKKILTNLLFLIIPVFITAQNDTMKVLFVGNSFTYYNDYPAMFKQMAQAVNRPVLIQTHAPGGVSVGDTSQGTMAHMNNPALYALIRSNDWDYLVLQDNQGRFVYDYGVFPASSKVIEGHLKIRDSLLYHNPCAHMLWFAGWGPKSGYPPFSNTGTGLISRIYNNYRYLLDTAGQVIAPIGPAWQRIIANYPGIELWDADDVHPGPKGSFLTASVVFSSIFKSSPMHSSWMPSGFSISEDSILKNTAWQTVSDSMNYTGLNLITPLISMNGNSLSIAGYSSCIWYLNGSFLSSGAVSIPFLQDGEYQAVAMDPDGCEFLSLHQHFLISSALEDPGTEPHHYNIYPNPVQTTLIVETAEFYHEICLLNSSGQVLKLVLNPSKSEIMDLSAFPSGVYFIKLTGKDFSSFVKPIIH